MKWHMKETTRQITLNLVIVLCLINLGVFIMMMIQGRIMKNQFSMVLGLIHSLEGSHLYYQVIYIGLVGTLFFFLYIFVAWANLFPSQRRFCNRFLKVSSLFNLAFIFVIIHLIVNAHYTLKIIQNEMQRSFKRVMSEYSSTTVTRVRMDETQQRFRCCGYNSYEDWFEVDWIKEHYQRDGHDPKDSTPYSCCDPFANRACIFFNVKHGNHENYQYQNDLTLFRKGCKDIISEELNPFFNDKILKPSYVLFPSMILCFVLSRFVSTSVSRAISRGNTSWSADGHLFKLDESENKKSKQNEVSLNQKKNNEDDVRSSKANAEDVHLLVESHDENDDEKVLKSAEKSSRENFSNIVTKKSENIEKIDSEESFSMNNEISMIDSSENKKFKKQEAIKNKPSEGSKPASFLHEFDLKPPNQNNINTEVKNNKTRNKSSDKERKGISPLHSHALSPSLKSLASYKMYPPLHYIPGVFESSQRQTNSVDNHYV